MATTAQKAKFVADFYATAAAMGPVLALRSKYDLSELNATYKALNDAIPAWSDGTMSDRDFNDRVFVFAGSVGGVVDRNGTAVLDLQNADGAAFRKLSESIPAVTSKKITGSEGEIAVTGKVPTSVLVFGVLAIVAVGLYYGAQTNKETAEAEDRLRRTKPMNKAQFQNWLEA